jgi:hypothetical protein
MFRRWTSPKIWITFGLGTLLLNVLAHQYPAWVEQWYSRGLFQGIRLGFDWTLGLLPFPAFYLFWIGIVAFWGLEIWKRPRALRFWPKIGFWLGQILGFASFLIGMFFWLWAFNYARVPVQEQLGLKLEPLDSTTLWQSLYAETQTLDSLRHRLVGADTNALNDTRFWPNHAEDTVRAAVEYWLEKQGFPVGGRVRGQIIYPEGTLFKFGAAGIYWPFIGQGNIEGGMHPLRKLPSMAHEMSHGYGFGDEGICNFLAFVAGANHPNAYIAYCTRLDYWETLAEACLENNPAQYNIRYRNTIPRGMVNDQHAIRAQHRKFKELAPEVRYQVYDGYLKAQGIASGMLNYNEVLMLVEAWKKSSRE